MKASEMRERKEGEVAAKNERADGTDLRARLEARVSAASEGNASSSRLIAHRSPSSLC